MAYDAQQLGPLDPRFKAVPVTAWGEDAAEFAARRPRLDELPTPLLTLDAGALTDNVGTLARWTSEVGVDLAPHGKTTMAPSLWREQLAAGALGLTVATPWQLSVALREGIDWAQAAYPVLDPAVLRWLSAPRSGRVLVWADGVDVVDRMAPHVRDAAQPLDVLVELGGTGGRTGARSLDAAVAVARAVRGTPGLRLAGVAGYEGAFAHDASDASLATVRAWVDDLAALHGRLTEEGVYPADVPGGLVVSAGGSAYYDVVVEGLARLHDRPPVSASSCGRGPTSATTTGSTARSPPRTACTPAGCVRRCTGGSASSPSRTRPGARRRGQARPAVRRGLPVVQAVRRGGVGDTEDLAGCTVSAMNDQHAFVRFPADVDLRVGDVLRLGISHPCTAFDKWGLLPVVDDALAPQPVLVDWVRTVFG